jgi:hypothetical protein
MNSARHEFSQTLSHIYTVLHLKYPYYCRILTTPEFNQQILKIQIQIPNFIKNLPLGVKLFKEGGRTDRQSDIHDEINKLFFFRNFANKNWSPNWSPTSQTPLPTKYSLCACLDNSLTNL